MKSMFNDKLIELPDYGRLIVVSDIHGNFEDYQRYVNLWDESDKDFHIVFLGDLIHSSEKEDGSIEILDDAIEKSKCPNFHVLLGNHEWVHIVNKKIYKGNEELTRQFEILVSHKKGFIEPSLTNYIKFFKSMPYFVKTANGLFLSHSGPSDKVRLIEVFDKMIGDGYLSPILKDFLWNRYNSSTDYTKNDIVNFLEVIGSKYMVIGHNPLESYKVYGRQMILSSSFGTKVKTYLDIDLSKEINSMKDVQRQLKFIH